MTNNNIDTKAECCHLRGAVNFIRTLGNLRAFGIILDRVPLFAWAVLITAVLLLLSLPVLPMYFIDDLFY